MENLLKPIGRRTYVIGLFIISLLSSVLAMVFLQQSGFFDQLLQQPEILKTEITESISLMIPITIFFIAFRMFWDFKRLKDISTNKYYYFLLFIPFLSGTFNLLFKSELGFSSFVSNVENSSFIEMQGIMTGLFSFISFVYTLFLVFKKGENMIALSKQTNTSSINQ